MMLLSSLVEVSSPLSLLSLRRTLADARALTRSPARSAGAVPDRHPRPLRKPQHLRDLSPKLRPAQTGSLHTLHSISPNSSATAPEFPPHAHHAHPHAHHTHTRHTLSRQHSYQHIPAYDGGMHPHAHPYHSHAHANAHHHGIRYEVLGRLI